MAAELLTDMLMAGALLGIALVLAALAAWMPGGPAVRSLRGRGSASGRSRGDALTATLPGVYTMGLWLLFVLPWATLWLARNPGGITP